jgi:hypothetical protein
VTVTHGHRGFIRKQRPFQLVLALSSTYNSTSCTMSKQGTVAEASPSPPLLPNEPLPSSSLASSSTLAPVNTDQPITSLGDGESDDEDEADPEEVWDPSEERLPGQDSSGLSKDKGKGKGKAKEGDGAGGGAADGAHPWQAVWSPDKNGELPDASSLHMVLDGS